jgi:hypothetical protein
VRAREFASVTRFHVLTTSAVAAESFTRRARSKSKEARVRVGMRGDP